MAAQIKVVGEQEIQGAAPLGALSAPTPDHSAAVAELQNAARIFATRLGAVETAIQGVPRAVGLLQSLAAALGARAVMVIALFGALGLATAAILSPSQNTLAIFGGYCVMIYLPLAILAYRGK